MCDNNITLLIRKAAADSSPGVVLLLNKNRECVGAIYKHYLKADMHAHHIVPWYNGGMTDLSNGVMLCKNCHTQRHL